MNRRVDNIGESKTQNNCWCSISIAIIQLLLFVIAKVANTKNEAKKLRATTFAIAKLEGL